MSGFGEPGLDILGGPFLHPLLPLCPFLNPSIVLPARYQVQAIGLTLCDLMILQNERRQLGRLGLH